MFFGGVLMPNIKSAKKRVEVIARKTLRNKMLKSSLKTSLRKAFQEGSDTETKLSAISALDKAVAKGILHKNNAARHKSRIAKLLKVS